MKGVARISFHGGGLFLPVKTPYERQLLFEHVERYAKRHGHVRLELNRREWTVRLADVQSDPCTVCSQPPGNLAYTYAERLLCHHCARLGLR